MNGTAIRIKNNSNSMMDERILIAFILTFCENEFNMSDKRKYMKCSELPSSNIMIRKLFMLNELKIFGNFNLQASR
jgi:hypothetical protein